MVKSILIRGPESLANFLEHSAYLTRLDPQNRIICLMFRTAGIVQVFLIGSILLTSPPVRSLYAQTTHPIDPVRIRIVKIRALLVRDSVLLSLYA